MRASIKRYLTIVLLLLRGAEMALAKTAKTVVSTKGQVILPKAIRESKGWGAGKELVVEETREGVLLRAARPFAPTKFEDVRGSLSSRASTSGSRISKRFFAPLQSDAMLAIDTNLVVRYLVRDDAAQRERATGIIESNEVFVTATVVLESEWVLRDFYELPRAERCARCGGFADSRR